MLTFKRKLILTQAQANRLDSWMGVCRLVYNMCIEIRKEAYKNQQITVHRFALDAQIKDIRGIDWIADVPFDGLSDAINQMDLAYRRFFKGGGFPRFRSKKRNNSIRVRYNCYVRADGVKIPKIGWLKIFNDSPVIGKIKCITIKKEAAGYFACITTDAIKSIQCQDENQVLGIDVGVKHFAVDSNGAYLPNPRHFKVYERRLRIENRSLARKKKGGKNWLKQVQKLSRLHSKIGNVRKDFLHKYSTGIAKENHTVFMEDLNVAGMVQNKRLSKNILDCGWATFREMLEYKTRVIAINPKYTSQTCSACGHKDVENRKTQAEFACTNCGNVMNADHNAALTILSKGIASVTKRNALV